MDKKSEFFFKSQQKRVSEQEETLNAKATDDGFLA
jgi:hypothetical protein